MSPATTTCDGCRIKLGLQPRTGPTSNPRTPKTRVAYHEAGHAVCALELGHLNVNASIRQGYTPAEILKIVGLPLYCGECWHTPQGPSRTDCRIVSVAGEVAEELLMGWSDWSFFSVDSFNPTDGRDLTPETLPLAISRAVEILTRRWSLVRSLAELLESDGRLEPHVAHGLFQCELAADFLREKRTNGKGSPL